MSFRPPSNLSGASASEVAFDALGHEILAEKAAALGSAGRKAEKCLTRLQEHDGADAGSSAKEERDAVRNRLLKEAADAVYAWFIQRELCGFRRHEGVIREFGIPREVLIRLGAR
ncbi:hypothetical protein ASD44_09460 [Mesorhizobium sp. Root554]|uniref:DUF6665 family protein n=1 Tax=unclassified Mesorhizobium TaxID=325217 RepID=UPI0006FCBC0E|nr:MULTISPECIES: DUF6665 family protein [unclassified Mesorhizobium]KQZ14270.1 hypothetical protein ASD27_09470 [Mesorhizobium sp. Root1471]KQZ36781.1 hypothetical protein ASD44_09460 [Mesorhizobium sp. Root554]